MRTKLDPKSIKTYFVGYSSTSRAYRFWKPVVDKIIESADYTIDEKSGKYSPDFPPDSGRTDYINIPINPLPQMTDPAVILQQPIEIMSNISNGVVGDLNSSESWSPILRPNEAETVESQLHTQAVDIPNFDISSPVLSTRDTLATSSIVELDDVDDEPHDPRFRSIQELLNSTPRLPDYPNFPELSEEPELPDLLHLDLMQQDAIRFSNALLASVGATIQEPQTYHEAISSIDSTSWQAAMDHEYASLIEN